MEELPQLRLPESSAPEWGSCSPINGLSQQLYEDGHVWNLGLKWGRRPPATSSVIKSPSLKQARKAIETGMGVIWHRWQQDELAVVYMDWSTDRVGLSAKSFSCPCRFVGVSLS